MDAERGSAVVEFLGGTVVLVVPLVYLVLTLAQVQAAAFAAEGAARDTGRIIATASDAAAAAFVAEQGVELAFADHGIVVVGSDALEISCSPTCEDRGARVHVTVTAQVPLPLIPGGGLTVPISAEAVTNVDLFREHE